MIYMGLLQDATSTASAIRACEPIRAANNTHTTPAVAKNQETNPAKVAQQRLEACDSFGFERGTEAHAECAMKLFMNEQNQGTVKAATSSNNQQTFNLRAGPSHWFTFIQSYRHHRAHDQGECYISPDV